MKGSLRAWDAKAWTVHYPRVISNGYYANLPSPSLSPLYLSLFLHLLVSNERAWLGFLRYLK